ncbi:MAG: FecR domain-containing protein [Bacteroidota bacterium]
MKFDTEHMPDEQTFMKYLTVSFDQSQDDVWNNIAPEIEEPVVRRISWQRITLTMAACILLLIACGVGLRSFTRTTTTQVGLHKIVGLPDGSQVILNADSRLEFKPFWWWMERRAYLEGEGYFEVAEGKKFTISTRQGEVSVLGTSFDVKSRTNEFQVYCTSGKVEVKGTAQPESFILTPGMKLRLEPEFEQSNVEEEVSVIAWKDDIFFFASTPLYKVAEEFELQYGGKVSIEDQQLRAYRFQAKFQAPASLRQALHVLELTFDIEVEEKGDNHYNLLRKKP